MEIYLTDLCNNRLAVGNTMFSQGHILTILVEAICTCFSGKLFHLGGGGGYFNFLHNYG